MVQGGMCPSSAPARVPPTLLTLPVLGHHSTKGPSSFSKPQNRDLWMKREKQMSQHLNTSLFSAYLMGMMLENKRRKRMICRYQRPAKCWRATMTRDTTTKAPKRIFVRQFTSRSNRPICGTAHRAKLVIRWCNPQPARRTGPSPMNTSTSGKTVGSTDPHIFG